MRQLQGNKNVAVFREMVEMLLRHYAERKSNFVDLNKAVGSSNQAIKAMHDDPKGKWAADLDKLELDIKSEVAGLINRIHQESYMKGLA